MPLPSNFDAEDLTLVARAVKSCHRDCREAGKSYREISHLIWCLDSIITTVESSLFQNAPSLIRAGARKRHLAESIRGCEAIVDQVVSLLETYGSLDGRLGISSVRRVLNSTRFPRREFEQRVYAIRGRLMMGVTTIMLQLDDCNIFVAGQRQNTLDVVRRQMREGIKGYSTALWNVAERFARIRAGAGIGSNERNEELDAGWREVREELRSVGFSKEEVRWSKRVIMAYLRESLLLAPSVSRVSRNPTEAAALDAQTEIVQSEQSIGHHQIRTRPRASTPTSHMGASMSIPFSPPPSYASGSQSNRSDSISTLVPSSDRTESRPPPPYAPHPEQVPHTMNSQRSITINAGHLLLIGMTIAGVSYAALNQHRRRRRR